jgi:hypothetical protein
MLAVTPISPTVAFSAVFVPGSVEALLGELFVFREFPSETLGELAISRFSLG